ncbi:MAG: repressor LexA [Nitrospirae bacterium]|nr:repressor LexA [Nitrospirota bacterium]
MNISEPTDRQKEVLEFIKGHVTSFGYPPTIREICGHFGFTSPISAQQHVEALVRKGLLKRGTAKRRALQVVVPTSATLFPIIGRVRAGQPILAVEDIEDYVAVDRGIFKTENGFVLRVVGNSMIEAGILPGDLVLIDPDRGVQDGDIAIVLLGEEATLKRFYRQGEYVRLVPENSEMEPIVVSASEVRLVGRAVGVIRRL